jgi:hypothetical protein
VTASNVRLVVVSVIGDGDAHPVSQSPHARLPYVNALTAAARS